MRNKIKKASPLRWMLRRYVFLLVAVVMITFAAFPMQGMTRVMSVRWSLEQLEEGEELTSAQVRSYTAELTKNFVYSPLNLEMLCLLFGGLPLHIAIPILATFSAGASFTPSPVTATNSPSVFSAPDL